MRPGIFWGMTPKERASLSLPFVKPESPDLPTTGPESTKNEGA